MNRMKLLAAALIVSAAVSPAPAAGQHVRVSNGRALPAAGVRREPRMVGMYLKDLPDSLTARPRQAGVRRKLRAF